MIRPAAVLFVILLSACSSNDGRPPVDGGTGGSGGGSGAPAVIESFTASDEFTFPGHAFSLSWVVTGDEPIRLGIPLGRRLRRMDRSLCGPAVLHLVGHRALRRAQAGRSR